MNPSLFIAIEMEELPAGFVDIAQKGLEQGLKKLCSGVEYGTVQSWASPRHIAVSIENLPSHTPSVENLVTGPPQRAAFRDGIPTKAAIGFAKGKGADVSELQIVESKRGPVVALLVRSGGESIIEKIAMHLESLLSHIPFPKKMSWGMGTYSWPRPIHQIVSCYDDVLIPCSAFGIQSQTHARGHRLSRTPFLATNAKLWCTGMRDNWIEPDPKKRRTLIEDQLQTHATNLNADIQDLDLIEEVRNLVEWPVTIVGRFPKELLFLPPKLLVEAMKIHQRVFPLYQNGELTEMFLAVTNQPYAREPDVASMIADGNKRVLTARFYDAKFFYAEDRKKTLIEHGTKLADMMWIRKGGSVAEKVERIQQKSKEWAARFNADEKHCARASLLCKNDLCTQMVYEFPELEGHVGMLLAGFDGEHPDVATAIEEHRMPRFSADIVAPSAVGKVVAVADRWDTLTHCFALGLQPKGSGDPLGLRRAALGFVRTLIEAGVDIDIQNLTKDQKNGALLCDFIMARLRADLQEKAATDVVNAVFATGSTQPTDIVARLNAMNLLSKSEDYSALRSVFKRVMGLSKDHNATQFAHELFEHKEEHNLASRLEATLLQVQESNDHYGALTSLCALKPELEDFFSTVMVMVDEPSIKNNRLSLLKSIANAFFQIADFSLLSSES